MEKHLICLDLDGTLLNTDKEITPYTKKVLYEVKKQGHELIISTGRPYRASEPFYKELNMSTPVVNFNGAFVHHPKDPNFKTVHEAMDLNVAVEIANRMSELNIQNIVAEVQDNVYLHYHDDVLFDAFSMGEPNISIGHLSKTMKNDPTTLLIQAEESEIPKIRAVLDDLFLDAIEHRRWGAPFPIIELVRKGINKSVGVDYIRKYLNIKREHTIAFGDEDNDTEMLKYVNTGVAMANAIDDIQSVADVITDTNDNDGIGKFLNEYFKLNITEG